MVPPTLWLDDLVNTADASEPMQRGSEAVNEPEAPEDKSVLEVVSDVADAPDADEAADAADADAAAESLQDAGKLSVMLPRRAHGNM